MTRGMITWDARSRWGEYRGGGGILHLEKVMGAAARGEEEWRPNDCVAVSLRFARDALFNKRQT